MQQIAVIDDDPEVIDLLMKWLNDIIPDCQVTPFSELEPALTGIATTDFDLVVSDVDLGSGSDKFGGVKIAKALDTRRSPLLVISGYSVQEGVFRALGAWDYLQKPISEGDFKTEVKRALMYRRGLTENTYPGSRRRISSGARIEDQPAHAGTRAVEGAADPFVDVQDRHRGDPCQASRNRG